MRILALWCPDWPVTAAGFNPDELVAVIRSNRVVAASSAAREDGIRIGLRRREAESRCPGLVVVAQDLPGEARAFEQVVNAVIELVPRVEVSRPGLLALDAQGPSRYFGGEEALGRRVVEVARSSLDNLASPLPRVGVADGRTAAGLAARHGVVVPAGGNRVFLAPFPIAVLGPPDLVEVLGKLGIHTLGSFAALPASSVLARFGTEAARIHAEAQGHHQELLDTKVPSEELASEASFAPPLERVDQAAFAGRPVAADLVDQLERRGLACSRLRIEIETEHAESRVRVWRGDPGFSAQAMVERLRWQFHGWVSDANSGATPTAGIVRLRLVADEAVPVGGHQPGFWGEASYADRRAARGLDRLRGMLGSQAVFTGALTGGRSPGDRAVLVPWGEPGPGKPDRLPWPGSHPLPAPALVHPVPLAAEVVDAAGQVVTVSGRGQLSGDPHRLSIGKGPWTDLVGWAGPWTLDERWWDRSTRRRRARFQLAGRNSAHLCAIEGVRWWVEATYD